MFNFVLPDLPMNIIGGLKIDDLNTGVRSSEFRIEHKYIFAVFLHTIVHFA